MTTLHQTDLIRLRAFQFSLRRMIAVGILMAVLFLVLGPWLRPLPQELVVAVVGMWFVAVAIFCAVLGFGSVYFRGVLERAGPILCVLPRDGHLRESLVFLVLDALQIFVAVFFTMVVLDAFGSAYAVDSIVSMPLSYLALFGLLLWFIAFSLGGTTIFLLRSNYAAVCEHGLIHVAIFIPWQRVRADEWRTGGKRLRLVIRSRWLRWWTLEVDAEDRDEVEAILQQVRPKYYGAEQDSRD